MENRVGDNAPTPQKAADLLKRLNDIVAEFGKFGVVLSKEERSSLLRGRKDAEQMAVKIGDIAKKHDVTVSGFPLDGMMNDLKLAATLRAFEGPFQLGAQLVDDTIAQAETEMWQAFLAHYGVLQSLAARNPQIAEELKPVVEFMRVRRRPPANTPASGGAPPATDPPKTP